MAAKTSLTPDDWREIERVATTPKPKGLGRSKHAVHKWRQDGIPAARLPDLHRLTGISIRKMDPSWPSESAA